MKRIAVAVLLTVCFCALLCSCDWWQGHYSSVSPHKEENARPEQEVVNAFSYLDLQNAVVALVESGQKQGVVAVTLLNEKYLDHYMQTAIEYATDHCAIGAYAVEEITYEIGTNAGKAAIAVEITYNYRHSEILTICKADNMDQAKDVIAQALKDCEAGVVMKIEDFTETDFTQLVQDYVDTYPESCMEMPQVSVSTYPKSGEERVVELAFTYQTSREALRNMQTFVEPVFRASDLNVSGVEQESAKFSLIYSFLMERYDYTVKTSITPAYSLLHHGVGDCKAFAVVFAAMCRRGGLECTVISGTRDGEPWVWNVICEDGIYYHVDLLRSNSAAKLQRMSTEDMQGYVWDYSAYPFSMQRRG